MSFGKFCILQLLLESWFSTFIRGLDNLAAVHHNMGSLLRQSLSEGPAPELSSEKLPICKISHFTTFLRILIFSLTIIVRQTYSCLQHLVVSLQCQSFTKKLAVGAIFRNFLICEISHFKTFTRILAFNHARGLGNFAAIYYNMVPLLRQNFSESQVSEVSSEKLVICEILHFTTFPRIFVCFQQLEEDWPILQL